MARKPRFDILFDPVRIGPVTAPNRFYQVPHASGMTNTMPHGRAAFRAMKAAGGWGTVCTGAVSIHPSSDDAPLPLARLWSDADIPTHALMTDAVHQHGALAGIELWHGGAGTMNRVSRIPPLSPSGLGWMPTHVGFIGNQKSRAMGREDFAALRGWYAGAARRARQAGFDIVYVYAGMGYLLHEFLLPALNHRTDAYGGSVANRCRLIGEIIEDMRGATHGACAIALRISLEELRARPGLHAESEAHEVVMALSDQPDLWDVKMDSSPSDCPASRFAAEGSHEPVIDFVRRLTTRPVVGVGRFTSPDAMVSQIRRGVLDLIGAARPSIADPFLPRKIDAGCEDDIRECIGCNICIASWHEGVPIRCTQNATVGEEWRRGWHPEIFVPRGSNDRVLIVGAGPAGLECALTLGRRFYDVAVADRSGQPGGRLVHETKLPGLAAWRRALDYRLNGLRALANVSMFLDSDMKIDDILAFGAERVVIATGAEWTRALYDARLEVPGPILDAPGVFTPDDVFAGRVTTGPVLVFDYENYYMAGCIAEQLARQGLQVTYATPAGHASAWSILTNEQPRVYEALAAQGVALHTTVAVSGFDGGVARLVNIFTNAAREISCASLVIVGHRSGRDALHSGLHATRETWADHGIRDVTCIGDAAAPGAIVHAIHAGALYARDLDMPPSDMPYALDELFTDPVAGAIREIA